MSQICERVLLFTEIFLKTERDLEKKNLQRGYKRYLK